MDSTHQRLESVFRDVFDNENLELREDMSQDTTEDWDSFSQVKLVIAVSEEFGVQLSTDEVLNTRSVADWLRLLSSKNVL
jgi:acyl carrier protein